MKVRIRVGFRTNLQALGWQSKRESARYEGIHTTIVLGVAVALIVEVDGTCLAELLNNVLQVMHLVVSET